MGVYQDLGLQPLINAWGTVTAVGGSLMAPQVLDAMREAAGAFVDLHALQRRAGERIADALEVDAACVTAGAAAGLVVAAAACAEEAAEQRPPDDGRPGECLMLRAHRNRYDAAVTAAGLRVVEVGSGDEVTAEELRAAVTDRTALLLFMAEAEGVAGSLPLEIVAAVMRERGVRVVVDAAAELPPRTGLARRFAAGADLVVVSGGKEIGGPQSSGMILGGVELIDRCTALAYPHHGIGRAMKTDKETIVGLMTAVELFARRDESARFAEWERRNDELLRGLRGVSGLEARRHLLTRPGIQPASIPRVYVRPLHRTAAEVAAALRTGDPAIVVGVDGDDLALNPQCLSPAQVQPLLRAVIAACAPRVDPIEVMNFH
ncbi:aminotransferase class V-fold PLP-dependent enzyme [Microbacterium sp. p3-SID336]|uniref:aminotransferase class V-fold PLP-dependent enzyme n=1 Tax=Microbacterium sp. p3-SID336 TaxID=2916212 RepID=UPI0021A2DD4E|nr:aminotransferase class V-fold PLP-dependent enzyme [Microbacterium sp. p3-SID336]MCT1478087.1 aminotransferase class V-fold PLP-dependent enzyme [Microbacterium sp. p3-SID336]